MRANEFLTEERLDEVDWSKLKKAIAVGAISLASLGLPGISQADVQGMTDQQFIDHWHKWYPSQSDAEIMRALNNQKDLEKWSKDSRDKIEAEYKERTDKIRADSDATMARIKADAAERDIQYNLQKQQEFEKNSPPTPEAQLSKFSIKGLRFGMSLSQVLAVTHARSFQNDFSKWDASRPKPGSENYDQELTKWSRSEGKYNFSPPVYDWYGAMNNFTIGGYHFSAEPEEYNRVGAVDELTKGRLGMLWTTISPSDFDNTVEIFSKQYGRPKLEKNLITTRMGIRDTNIIARWQVKDAYITIQKYSGKITEGSIVIDSIGSRNTRQQLQQQNKVKSTRDF